MFSDLSLSLFTGIAVVGGLVGSGCPLGSGDPGWSPNILDIFPQFTTKCVKCKKIKSIAKSFE